MPTPRHFVEVTVIYTQLTGLEQRMRDSDIPITENFSEGLSSESMRLKSYFSVSAVRHWVLTLAPSSFI